MRKKIEEMIKDIGEAKILIIFVLVLGFLVGLAIISDLKKNKYDVTGGFVSLFEFGSCVHDDEVFYMSTDMLEFAGRRGNYEIKTDTGTYNMQLEELILLRFFNKEIDRYIEANNLTWSSDIRCYVHVQANYTISMAKKGHSLGIGESGVVRYESEEFTCTAPDGMHYECDFQEKEYLYQLFKNLLVQIEAISRWF